MWLIFRRKETKNLVTGIQNIFILNTGKSSIFFRTMAAKVRVATLLFERFANGADIRGFTMAPCVKNGSESHR